jgi:hypothetical protein
VPLPGPSPEAAKQLIALPIDVHSGQRIEAASSSYGNSWGQQQSSQASGRFMEYFRLDRTGRFEDSQYKLVSRSGVFGGFNGPDDWDQDRGLRYRRDYDNSPYFGNQSGPPRAPEPRAPEPRFRSQGPLGGGGFPFPFTPPWAQPQYEQQQQQQAPPQPRQRTGERSYERERPQVRGQRTQPDYLGPGSR